MTTAYTSLLGLALPVTGELSGTWGDVVNQSITSLVDTAVAGTTNVSADSNVTLTTTTGASNQARQAILLFSGARTAIRTVTAPAQSKIYTVINATTGGFAVQLVGAGPTTGVTIANGARTVVAWNGSDFVEVSSPSSIILPGGTANGVLYLNGSKVVSSGSALTFDGTNLSVGAQGEVRVYNTANTRYGRFVTTSAGTLLQSFNGSGEPLILDAPDASAYINFNVNSTERMRLTSTGLGIGTSSPTMRLSVQNTRSDTAGTGFLAYTDSGTAARRGLRTNTSNAWCFDYYNGSAWSEQMQIDSSGNLGLGVTPTQAFSTSRAIQIGSGGLIEGRTNDSTTFSLASNAYLSSAGNWTYSSNNRASLFALTNGSYSFGIAAAGTGTITFTQAMTLEATGELRVGSEADGCKLTLSGAAGFAGNGLSIYETSTGNNGRLRLSQGAAAVVYNATYSSGSNAHVFQIGGGEVARIDSSGNLLVGASSFQANTPRLYVTKSSQGVSSNNIIWVNDSAATATAAMHVWSFSQTTTPASANFVDAYYNGVTTLAFRIAGNGNVTNANNSYGSTSDIKLKENIVDASPKLDKLLQVRVRNYNLKGDYEQHKQIGVIAQELETVFPSMVDETPDRDAEGNDLGTTTKSVKYSVFVPMLIKALQEQQAIIESLKARLDAANL